MLYRKPPKLLRIPHQLAALAAVVLLITAWTGNGDDRSARSSDADGRGFATVPQSASADDHSDDAITDRRSRSPASLMLFRFN